MYIAENVKDVLRRKTKYATAPNIMGIIRYIYNECTGIEMQYLRCFKRLGRIPINSPKELLLHESRHLYVTPLGVYHLPENRSISIYTQGPPSRLKSNALSAYNKRWYAEVAFIKAKLGCNIERGKALHFDSVLPRLYIPLSTKQLLIAKTIYSNHNIIILAMTTVSPDIIKISYLTGRTSILRREGFEPKEGYMYKQTIITDCIRTDKWYTHALHRRTATAVNKRLNSRGYTI